MTDEISFDEARALEVRTVIAEFPQIQYLSGPEPVDRNTNIWELRYRCVVVKTGVEFNIIVRRGQSLSDMQYNVRLQIRTNLDQKIGEATASTTAAS
jgi:hypothetical protein